MTPTPVGRTYSRLRNAYWYQPSAVSTKMWSPTRSVRAVERLAVAGAVRGDREVADRARHRRGRVVPDLALVEHCDRAGALGDRTVVVVAEARDDHQPEDLAVAAGSRAPAGRRGALLGGRRVALPGRRLLQRLARAAGLPTTRSLNQSCQPRKSSTKTPAVMSSSPRTPTTETGGAAPSARRARPHPHAARSCARFYAQVPRRHGRPVG